MAYRNDEGFSEAFKDKSKPGPYDNQYVVLRNINKVYDNKFHAVHNFNLVVQKNEFVVFVGPSGCGKSTTLRMIAGLEDISGGELYINGEYANDLLSKDRDIAMVFQNYALYPNMTIYKNLSFALKVRKFPYNKKVVDTKLIKELEKRNIENHKKLANLKMGTFEYEDLEGKIKANEDKIQELKTNPSLIKTEYVHLPKKLIDDRVRDAARILEIEDQLPKKPKELSGGQRQRVALGRAIVRNARIFLMDEPLSNLDAKLRVQMRSEIIRLHKKLKATTIYVTHDQTEAMTMADRIVVMKLGYVQQIGTPIEIYRNPANLFVASFIGSPAMNLIRGTYHAGTITFANGETFTLSEEQIQRHDVFYREQLSIETRSLSDYLERLAAEKNDFMKHRHPQKEIDEFNQKYDELVEKKNALITSFDSIAHGGDHDIILGVRPEDLVECSNRDPDGMKVEIKLSELLGDQYFLHFDFGGKDILSKVQTEKILNAGETINLKIKKDKVHIFDPNTELRI